MRFNNLQILRLFAAAGVVLFHLGEYLRHGYGVTDGPVPWLRMPWIASAFVPLFFALSGFVLTHALQTATPGRYLLLRGLRLYPGFWLAVALMVIVHRLGLWPGSSLHVPDPAPNRRTVFLLPTSRVKGGQYPLMIEWTLIYEVFLSFALLVLWRIAGAKRLPVAVVTWLVVLAVKSIFWPGYGTRVLPVWRSIWASACLVPFFLGSLAYRWRDRGRRWRWAVLALVVGLTLLAGAWITKEYLDPHLWLRGFAAALTVWFLVQVRDASPRNPLVVGGGYSYGLYLVHVPLMLLAMWAMPVTGVESDAWARACVAGVAALVIGLAYGRLEEGLYGRTRRLAEPARLAAARLRLKRAWRRRRRADT